MQDVCRYLLFSSLQGDGLTAQLHALRLSVAAAADAARDDEQAINPWNCMRGESSRLLARASATPGVAEARCDQERTAAPPQTSARSHVPEARASTRF